MQNFNLGRLRLGDNCKPLFFPDIGTFFNQDIAVAKAMVKKLHNCGAPIIKGEILHDHNIAAGNDAEEEYLGDDGKIIKEKIKDVIGRKIVPLSSYDDLFTFVKSLGLEFVLSVYDFVGANFAKDIGASALKIASSNIVHQPLIEHVSKLGLPVIIDTGKSSFDEIARAVQWGRDVGLKDLILQHSPEAPPAPISSQNLRLMGLLKQTFNCQLDFRITTPTTL